VKREEAVTREMTRKLAEDKKMSKKEKDERYDGREGRCN
jgi:translocon-associated protein subunit gamma